MEESAALKNAKELYEKLKERHNEGNEENLVSKDVVWLADLAASIAQAQALEKIAHLLHKISIDGIYMKGR